MERLGKHIIADVNNCNIDLINSYEKLKTIIMKAATIANATILHIEGRMFDPQGVTVYCLLLESHISIHTWPEYGTALIDAFTCGEQCHPENAIDYIIGQIEGKVDNYICLNRGEREKHIGELNNE